jgi:hypothetical protein
MLGRTQAGRLVFQIAGFKLRTSKWLREDRSLVRDALDNRVKQLFYYIPRDRSWQCIQAATNSYPVHAELSNLMENFGYRTPETTVSIWLPGAMVARLASIA